MLGASLREKIEARARAIGAPLLVAGSVVLFAAILHTHYPLQHWLFWRYAGYWLACAIWAAACTSGGHLLIKRVLGRSLPLREHLGTSFAAGVFVFYFAMSLAGLVKLFGAPLFFLLPLAMLAAGGPSLFRLVRRYLKKLPLAKKLAREAPPAWLGFVAVAFGLIGLGMIYFSALTPENVQFDSRWKHFALAEEYVVTGGVRRFAEGWTVETNPHLATYLYTWGFLLPFGRLFDRIELAAHMEIAVVVATTFSIPALVRRLVPGSTARYAWVVRLLFPGVFLYDSSPSGGADHVAALFTIPLFTLLIRARRDLSPRLCALVALMAAGGMMAKLTGLLMLLPAVVLLLGARSIGILIKPSPNDPRGRLTAVIGPLVALAAGLVLTSTFWVKNWVWYGDPIYPSLHGKLALRPWTPDAADLFEWGYKDHQFWRPKHDTQGVLKTLSSLYSFSFIPNDYERFHGKVPVFGSLFTLLLIPLPLLKGARRVVPVVAATAIAIFTWYWTHHQDRYLQTLVPWMAAASAAILILLWRNGLASRIALGALVSLQAIWGGDVYFFPAHAHVRQPVKVVVDLLAAGHARDYEGRFKTQGIWPEVAAALPKGARVLLHDNHVHLGVRAETVNDWGGWQFGISYGWKPSAREVYETLKGMGVTHITWEGNETKGWDSLAGDIAFYRFVYMHAKSRRSIGHVTLAEMPTAPPAEAPEDQVVFLGCDDESGYRSGLYALKDLRVPVFGPKSRKFPQPRKALGPTTPGVDDMIRTVDIVVLDSHCRPSIPGASGSGFELVARRKMVRRKRSQQHTIWLRTKGKSVVPAQSGAKKPPAVEDDDGRPEE